MGKRKGLMGLLDSFLGRSSGPDTDRILTPAQIEEVLDDDYGNQPNAVVFVYDQSGRAITPADLFLIPLLNAQFAQNPRLGMVYGTGSGCALLSKAALVKVQALHEQSQSITSCQAYMDALERMGYEVKQDPKLSLDLLQ